MEKAGKTNMAVKALAENSEPDHDTIATFISTNKAAVAGLFTQAVMQCDELELITGEMFALDGCKLAFKRVKGMERDDSRLEEKEREAGKTHITDIDKAPGA